MYHYDFLGRWQAVDKSIKHFLQYLTFALCNIWTFAVSEHCLPFAVYEQLQYLNIAVYERSLRRHNGSPSHGLRIASQQTCDCSGFLNDFMCGIFLLTLSKISSIILFFYWFPMILIWSVVMIMMMMMLMMMVIMLVIMMICWSEIPRCCPLPLRLLLGPSLFGHPWCQVWCLHPDHWSWSSSQLLAKHKLLHHICHIHPTPNIVYIITTIGLHCELWPKPLK